MSLRINHFLGGVLLIAGTAIGAGMLAIPMSTAFTGFFPTLGLLVVCWLFMTITALLLLEVNLHLKGDVNLVTMASKTLGVFGKVLCWSGYLLLLYCLTAAYISGSAPIFAMGIQAATGWELPSWLSPFPILIFFGTFVYLGTRAVDLVNRVFIIALILSFALLVFFLPPYVDFNLLRHADSNTILVGLSIVITSFGFHIIIPSLTTYMNHNRRRLQLAVITGSLIPLFVYILWEFLILGTIPLTGEYGLISTWKSGGHTTQPLMHLIDNKWIGIGAGFFSFFAIVTSFLGVSLSLADFLRDGLKIKRTGKGRLIATMLTFIPPMIFVIVYEHGFLLALQYAAIFVAILLGILPALMAWTLPKPSPYRSFFGRCLLITIILGSLFIIVVDLMQEDGKLNKLIEKYDSEKV